ncbi:hypothetical protein CW304_13585 [Bacillus sp. UFRGS-B20]|nr:hypothetical protein CW304_13585 [Bacillus sp. UFRGS-B20]
MKQRKAYDENWLPTSFTDSHQRNHTIARINSPDYTSPLSFFSASITRRATSEEMLAAVVIN